MVANSQFRVLTLTCLQVFKSSSDSPLAFGSKWKGIGEYELEYALLLIHHQEVQSAESIRDYYV